MRRRLALLVTACLLALAVALTAVVGLGGDAHAHGGRVTADTNPWTLWAAPPIEIAAIVLLALGYGALVRRAPDRIGRRHRLFFAGGIAVLLLAVCSPLAGLAKHGLLTAHMTQHTLIGAAAPLLLLLGLPRMFVAETLPPAWRRRLERVQHPAITLPLWVASTIVWLLPSVHHEVLDNNGLWLVQQASFLVTGLLLWGPVVERVDAPRWFGTGLKSIYMTLVWTVGLLTANLYWFSGTIFYESHADAARTLGFDPLQDQANAGTVMMLSHCLLAFGAVGVLFFRQAREGELRQRLLEAGVDAERIDRATREGTAAELAATVGVSARTRAGID